MEQNNAYRKGFVPYAFAAFLIGLVGGFSTTLGPAFVQDLGIPYNNTTWTALAQAMSTAACAPILGKCADVIGRKPTLLAGVAVFTLGNVLSALADSLGIMLLARFCVGLGTAAMTPVIIAYIVAEFPQEDISKGFSLYMLISSASVIAGPAFGGWIVSLWGWRTMLWICVTICAAVFLACLMTGREEPGKREAQRSQGSFDRAGAVLVLVFFSLLLCVPVFAQNFGWTSLLFLLVAAASSAALLLLIFIERRAVSPILSGRFMKRRSFIFSILALFLTQGLMQANMTNTIVFVNYTQPGNTVVSGYAISVMYIGMSLGAVLLGPLADRFEPKSVLLASFFATGVGCALLFFFEETTTALLLMSSLGVLGFGLGGNGTVFMKVVLSGLSPQEAGTGTGIYGLFRDIAAPFGVAVFVPLFTNRITASTAHGIYEAAAAVGSIHMLAKVELICIAAGIIAVLFLPKIRNGGISV